MKGIKIALSGTHGSGKTTLAHGVVAHLRSNHIEAVLLPEAARQSPFLLARIRSPESQLSIFLAHIQQELLYSLFSDAILIVDRTPLDMVAYTELFFPNERQLIQAMTAFAGWYMQTYTRVFRTTKLYDLLGSQDSLRPLDRSLQERASQKILDLLEMHFPSFVSLPVDATGNYVQMIANDVQELLKRSKHGV